jgi:hypothetical protein
MKKLYLSIAIFMLALFVHQTAFSQQAAESIGKIASINGPISYDMAGKSGYSDIAIDKAANMPIYQDDKVKSGDKTTGEISFNYGAAALIAENTEMQFGHYNMRINRGNVWINFKPVKTTDNKYIFKVSTPVGTIGIKGTRFNVNVDPATLDTTIKVTEGTVKFESNENNGAADITAGEKLAVAPGKPVGKPVKTEGADHILDQAPQNTNGDPNAPIIIDHNVDGMNSNTDN